MFSSSFLSKLFLAFVGVILLTATVVSALESQRIDDAARRFIERSLDEQSMLLVELSRARVATGVFDPGFQATIEALGRDSGTRLTVVALDGRVLADSDEHPSRMESHGSRPEFVSVRDGGATQVVDRWSDTVQRDLVYLAREVRQDDDLIGFVRTSRPVAFVGAEAARSRGNMALGVALVVLIASAVAFWIARRLTQPLREMTRAVGAMAAGDLARRLAVTGPDEIAGLAAACNSLAKQLQARMDALAKERSDVVATLRSMEEGVVATDEEQRVVILNDAARRILRITEEEFVGRPLWELTRLQQLTELVDTTIDEVREIDEEVVVTRRTGDTVVQFRSRPLRDASQAEGSRGAVVVCQDVTELRRLEQVRRDFVSNVAHELKTPLTVMRGSIEALLDEDGLSPEMRQRFLHKVRDQVARVTALVRDQLTLARLESSEVDPDWQWVDLASITRDALALVEPFVLEKSIELDLVGISGEYEDGVMLRGDAEALRQLVGNLIDNAVKYTPDQGSVAVRLREDGDSLHFEVQDSGLGLSKEDERRVFERFYRVDPGRSPDRGGTGLGLSIVRNVAVAHGGSVGVESELGRGSRFFVNLPRDATQQRLATAGPEDSVPRTDFPTSSLREL